MDFIPVNEPLLDGNELAYVTDCIQSGWISSEGEYVRKFETGMAERAGRKHGIAVSNGSVALELAIEALGINEGDEIILPTFTIISCAAPIVRRKAIPVVVDCDPDLWTMNVREIEEKITPRTKAIMAVHIYGIPVDMDPLLEIAKQHGLAVIEDAAEAHGLMYKDRPCGSFGDISIFSFYANKHVTTGEGGMLLTNDDGIASKLRSLRNLCFEPERRFVHNHLGHNYRISNVQAAIGVAQLEQLDRFLSIKETLGATYHKHLEHLSDLMALPVAKTSYAKNGYWVFGVVLKESANMTAAEAMRALQERGIGTRPFFYPMHAQPVFEKMGLFGDESLPVSEYLAEFGFYLPSGLSLTVPEIEHVCRQVSETLKG